MTLILSLYLSLSTYCISVDILQYQMNGRQKTDRHMAEVLAAAALALCLREGDYPGSDSPFNLNISTISSAKSQRAIVTKKVTSATCPKLFFPWL